MENCNNTDGSVSDGEKQGTSRTAPMSRRGALKLGGAAALGSWLYPGTAAAQQVYEIDEPRTLNGYGSPDDPTVEYRLTRDLTDVDDDVCFRIRGHNVVLNGNGYAIDGNNVGGIGVEVTEDATNAVVRDLRIRRFANYLGGIYVDNGADGTTGIYDCVIRLQRNGPGMYIRADSSDIVGNLVGSCDGAGLGYNAQRDPQHTIADNGFFANEGPGVSFVGLRIAGTVTVRGNVAVRNGEDGIKMTYRGATLENNTVMNNEWNGIWTRSDTTLVANSVSGNREVGIHIDGDRCRIEGNAMTANARIGVMFPESGDHTVRGNVVAGSTYGLLGSVDTSVIEDNTVSGCELGIYTGGSDSNRILGNDVRNNATGIFLFRSDDNEIRNNEVCNFVENIRLEDSSGNTVSGNQEC